MGITKPKEMLCQRKKESNVKTILSNDFSADVSPVYDDQKKRDFSKQGRRSFLDEFHTLYRKWIKNE